MNNPTEFETVSRVIRRRITQKVLASPDQPIVYEKETLDHFDAVVKQAIDVAGMAPFHFDRGLDGIAEPWRVHFIDSKTCRTLARKLFDWFELKPANKLPNMLSACGCLVMVNWLPQFRDKNPELEGSAEKKIEIDDEHLAATAAFVQNLLLLLTSAELSTYWSSGGQLGFPEVFSSLKIETGQKLLAAVFVEYPNGHGNVKERIPGKNRSARTNSSGWSASRQLHDLH